MRYDGESCVKSLHLEQITAFISDVISWTIFTVRPEFFCNRCYELLLVYNKRQRCVDLAAQGGGLVTPCRAFHRIRGVGRGKDGSWMCFAHRFIRPGLDSVDGGYAAVSQLCAAFLNQGFQGCS